MDKYQNFLTALNAVHFLLFSGVVDKQDDAYEHLKDLAVSLGDQLIDFLSHPHA